MKCDRCMVELSEERLREIRDRRLYIVLCKACEGLIGKQLKEGKFLG